MKTSYQILKDKHDELEQEVQWSLRSEIENSKTESKSVSTKCIKVNVFDYTELAIINDELTFLDSQGLQYSLYAECSLEDLVDILTKIA